MSIEKDWWVVQVLKALFSLPYAEHLSFKGGTSLSKCWHLIERFSEDVDIAINHEFLGFHEPLSKTQISDKLRRASCSFVRDTLQKDLREQIVRQGIGEEAYTVSVDITPVSTTDPETVTLSYRSLFDPQPYIINKVKIEVSGRSMSEPVQKCMVTSFIDEAYPIPQDNVVDLWRKDYETMCQNMIYGTSPSFDRILESLNSLITSIREEKSSRRKTK